MAFTTPRTYVAAEIHTAAHHNTYERDNIAWIATDSPACRAYNNANLSITSGGSPGQVVTLNSERFDNAAVHSTSVNTSRFTIPSGGAGKYIFGATWAWAIDSGGTTRKALGYVNATTIVCSQTLQPSAGHGSEGSISTVYAFSAADYIELYVYQDKGSAVNLNTAGNYSPEAFVFWFRT